MAARLVWTPKARADVKAIFLSIAREQPQTAERYVARLRLRVALLAQHPRAGGRQPEIYSSARMLVEAPYVILYETHPDVDEGDIHTVEVVRIVDGRRDLAALF